jgi:hypothetical protein
MNNTNSPPQVSLISATTLLWRKQVDATEKKVRGGEEFVVKLPEELQALYLKVS